MADVNVKVGLQNAEFKAGLDKTKAELGKFKKEVEGAFAGMGKALAGAFAFDKIVDAGRALFAFASNLRDTSDQLDIGIESLQKWIYAFGQGGAKPEDFVKSMKSLITTQAEAANGSEAAIAKFTRLGITFEQVRKESPEEILMRVADGVKNAKNPTEGFAAAIDLLGKSGLKLIPILKEGSAAIREMGDAAKIAKDKSIKIIEGWNQGWDTLGRT